MTQYIDIQTVIGYLENRLGNFLDGKASVASRGEEMQKMKKHFDGIVERKVTFTEKTENTPLNPIVTVYSDEEMTSVVGTAIQLVGGTASKTDVLNGTYWFKAVLADHLQYVGMFIIDNKNEAIEFMMAPIPKFTVTFEEENNEDGATIKIYSDAEYTTKVGGDLTTANGGIASTDLKDGEYYFKVTLETFAEYKGDFTVDGNTLTVEFELQTEG